MNALRGLLVALLLLLPAAAQAAEELQLEIGQTRNISTNAPIAKVVISESGVIEAAVISDNEIELLGLKNGRTNLTVFTVGAQQGTAYAIAVGTQKAKSSGGGGGGGYSLLQALRSQPGLAGVVVKMDGERTILTGTVADLESHARALQLAQAYSGNVVDLLQVTGNQMVAVEVRFAAVSATTLKQLGFNFASLGQEIVGGLFSAGALQGVEIAEGAVSFDTSLPLQSAFNLFLGNGGDANGIVSALDGAGLMQMLAEPTLLVRSGESARFLAGGEVPIPVPQGGANAGTVTIEYRPYGVRLEVQPVVLSNRRIVLKVAPEVSEIDPSNNLQINGFNVPAFRTRATSTTVELGDGQSFVLAGLLYSNSVVSESRFPWLGDIPIIGALFSRTNNAQERQELIIIATPRLVRPMEPEDVPPLPGTDDRYDPSLGETILYRQDLNERLGNYGLVR